MQVETRDTGPRVCENLTNYYHNAALKKNSMGALISISNGVVSLSLPQKPHRTARRAMAARTVRVASAARRPKGPRRSPGALAHSKRGRREASAGAATLRPRRPPCRAPGPRGVRPPGGPRGSSDGLVGFVCPTEFWGHVTPGDFFKIRQNRIYKFANRC